MPEQEHIVSGVSEEFDTPDEAAAWASSVFNPMSIEDDREVGGVIIRHPKTGKYYINYNVGKKGGGQVKITARKPKDHELVGLWHSHGAKGRERHLFSPGDARSVKQLGVPFYMVDSKGALRILRRRDAMRRSGLSGAPVRDSGGNPIQVRTKREQPLYGDEITPTRSRPVIVAGD